MSCIDSEVIGALRAFVAFVSKLKHALNSMFVSSSDELLVSLITSLSSILNHSASHRDTITQAAFLLIALALNLAPNENCQLLSIMKLARFEIEVDSNAALDCLSALNQLDSAYANPVAELALVRAIISQSPVFVLVAHIPSLSDELLFVSLLPRVLQWSRSLVPNIRYYGLQSVESWLTELSLC